MKEILTYLDDLDLLDSENIYYYINKCNKNELENLVITLRKIVSNIVLVKEYSPFSFVPSDNLAGTGGCNDTKCRIDRAQKLARFSAMYADTVYISLSTISDPCFFLLFDKNLNQIKKTVINDLHIISVYKELIDAEIIILTPPNGALCENCYRKHVLHLDDKINLFELISCYGKNIDIKVKGHFAKEKLYLLEIIEHSGYQMFNDKFYTVREDLIPTDNIKEGFIVEKFKMDLLFKWFRSNFYHLQYNVVVSSLHQSKFISSSNCDSNLIEITRPKLHNVVCLDENPIFNMPIMTNTPIQNVLNLREKEQKSFENYRIAIQNAISEQNNSSNDSPQYIYDKTIYPAFVELNNRISKICLNPIKTAITDFTIIGTVIGVGIMTGLIPENLTDIVTAIGGLDAAKSIGKSITYSIKHEKEEIKNNDFYFLWKLKNK